MEAEEPRHRPGKLGPSGQFVAKNLARIREKQGLSTTQLAKRLKAAGRPITPTGITKIENMARRVDVDDLVALSVVLGINPNALLFPPIADLSTMAVTADDRERTTYEIWQWADGRQPLHDDDDPDEFHVRVRPRGERYLARAAAPLPLEEGLKLRRAKEHMAERLFPDPKARADFLDMQRREYPELPWETTD